MTKGPRRRTEGPSRTGAADSGRETPREYTAFFPRSKRLGLAWPRSAGSLTRETSACYAARGSKSLKLTARIVAWQLRTPLSFRPGAAP